MRSPTTQKAESTTSILSGILVVHFSDDIIQKLLIIKVCCTQADDGDDMWVAVPEGLLVTLQV